MCIVEGREECILGGGEPIPQPNRDMLLELLIYHNIPVYHNAFVKEITENSVRIDTKDGEKTLDADSVVVSIGYSPNDDLYKQVYGATNKKVWLLGDAKTPATIMMAIRDGSAIGAVI